MLFLCAFMYVNAQDDKNLLELSPTILASPHFQIAVGDSNDNWGEITSITEQGFIFAGHTSISGNRNNDIHIFMTNLKSASLWSVAYRGSRDDRLVHSVQGKALDLAFMGQTSSYGIGGSDFFFAKIDVHGNSLFYKTYGTPYDDFCRGATQVADGGFVLAGGTRTSTQGSEDISVIKIDSTGGLIWSKYFGGYNYETIYSVQETLQGDILLFGHSNTWTDNGTDLIVVKIDRNGEIIWFKTYDNPGRNISHQGASYVCSNGQMLLSCFGDEAVLGGRDFSILKLDQEGAVLWSKTMGGSGDDQCKALIETNNGNILVVGSTSSFGIEKHDGYVVMLDANGTLLWSKRYGGSQSEAFLSVTEAEDSNFFLAGFTNSFGAGGRDQYCVQIDADGNSACYGVGVETVSVDMEILVHEIYPIRSYTQQEIKTTIVKAIPTHKTKLQLKTICE